MNSLFVPTLGTETHYPDARRYDRYEELKQ